MTVLMFIQYTQAGIALLLCPMIGYFGSPRGEFDQDRYFEEVGGLLLQDFPSAGDLGRLCSFTHIAVDHDCDLSASALQLGVDGGLFHPACSSGFFIDPNCLLVGTSGSGALRQKVHSRGSAIVLPFPETSSSAAPN